MRDYQETINWLYRQFPSYQKKGKTAYKEDLDNVKLFFNKYGLDYLSFETIHVAGTNGKGSVSHMLGSILKKAGYKVGLFTSPHLLDFTERIKINGEKISKKFIVKFFHDYKKEFQQINLSFFEMNVVMAFRYFLIEKVDVAIVEVGLGGRLDATNVIEPLLSIITNISFDHTDLLGDSIESIAVEKAGIIKRNRPILIGEKKNYTYIFEKIAKALAAPIYYTNSYQYDCDLKGDYQVQNINTAVTAVNLLNNSGYKITNQNVVLGLQNVISSTGLMGRWQIIRDNPTVICDIAHNINSIQLVFDQLLKIKFKKHVIIGFSSDKNIDAIISFLPNELNYYICGSTNSRIIDPVQISRYFKHYNLSYQLFDYAYNAYEMLLQKNIKNDVILITGSTFIVADILNYLDKV